MSTKNNKTTVNKTVVICLDGATFDLIDPFIAEGLLPNIKSLMQKGVRATLNTVHPPLTAPAWASFITGKNPGQHGVFDFIDVKSKQINVLNASSMHSESLWSILSRHDRKPIVINVPMTFPPEPVKGIIISGMMSPEPTSYPRELIKELQNLPRGYTSSPKIMSSSGNEHLQTVLDDHAQKEEATLHLLKEKEWDFLMVLFTLTDQAAHRFFKSGQEELKKIYSQADETIGRMLALVDLSTTNVILMSDHGFGPCDKTVNINNYFIEQGFIKFKPLGQVKYFLFKHNLHLKNLYAWASKIKLNKLLNKVSFSQRKKISGKMLGYEDLDWDKTLCYSKGRFGQIHINKKSLVDWNLTYEQAQEKVRQALLELKDEQGNQLVTKLFLNKEIYHGPYCSKGADIFIMMKEMAYIAYSQFSSSNQFITDSIYTNEWEGTHRIEGIFVASGPDFHKSVSLQPKHITDVPKTILHLYGLDSESTEMDGKLMEEALLGKIIQESARIISESAEISSESAKISSGLSKKKGERENIMDAINGLSF